MLNTSNVLNTLPELAQAALEHAISQALPLSLPASHLSAALLNFKEQQAGVFVTLKQHGDLRGCIGTIQAVQPNIIQEVMANAVSAGTQDHRFPPVSAAELSTLHYSVSVLHEPEAIHSLAELDPSQYGVIVSTRRKRGLLLPQLEGITDADQQVFYARQKAGILPYETIALSRFKVDFYGE
jgi:AmmeMemoRadiSam system protein A